MCSAPYNGRNDGFTGYDAPTRGYVTDALNGNYKTNGELNTSSGLYLHTVDGKASACIQAGGSTSYSEALRQAKAELDSARAPQRSRLHRLPHRRRGQHGQRLRL